MFACECLFCLTIVFSSRSENWSRKERNRHRSCWKGEHMYRNLIPCFWLILLCTYVQLCIDIFYQVWEKIAPGLSSQFDAPHSLPLIAPRPLLLLNGESGIFLVECFWLVVTCSICNNKTVITFFSCISTCLGEGWKLKYLIWHYVWILRLVQITTFGIWPSKVAWLSLVHRLFFDACTSFTLQVLKTLDAQSLV
jgi:hypothetical protein